MRILFFSTAHNSLSQRAFAELTDLGHEVHVQIASGQSALKEAAKSYNPDIIIAPFLKMYIPEEVWSKYTCIIVHPGIEGDRGPSSLDWAILNDEKEWGVTLLQANGALDGGDIWATCNFKMEDKSKSYIYRHQTADAAMKCLLETLEKFQSKDFVPRKLDYNASTIKAYEHKPMKQYYRSINWYESSDIIIRKIRCADSRPGVLDTINGEYYYLFGAHKESNLNGTPGEIIGKRNGAICRATGDGAIWISHLQRKDTKNQKFFKLPATEALKEELNDVPNIPVILIKDNKDSETLREIWYEEKNDVGYLYFEFYNGAMSTEQCKRLKEEFIRAKQHNTKVIVLMGGSDFWSNGIHLNVIEAANNPADESWENINAIDDLIKEIILTDDRIVISAIRGNAAAGGVILALGADKVVARDGIVLNPHYKNMGLYGSEYWTYLLPKRVGYDKAMEITDECLILNSRTAKKINLIDDIFSEYNFNAEITALAEGIASSSDYENMLQEKQFNRQKDEAEKPLEMYRKEELDKMWEIFYGEDKTYHIAKKRFVYKLNCNEPIPESCNKSSLCCS